MKEEKRMVGSYEVIACQRIGGEEIIVGEDKNTAPSERYLCCYVEQNDIFERYSSALASDGYAEIFEIYGQRIASAAKEVIERIDKEKALIGDGELIFTADKCEPITEEVNLNGKIVVIDSDVFSPEYQLATHQLMLCTGGFGAQPNARGRSCFCTSLYDGHDTKFYRQDIIESTARRPVSRGRNTGLRSRMPGAGRSSGKYSFAPISSPPSMICPNGQNRGMTKQLRHRKKRKGMRGDTR